jgi:hypothetical protein
MRRRELDSTSEREPEASLRGTIHRVSLFLEAVSGSPGRFATSETFAGDCSLPAINMPANDGGKSCRIIPPAIPSGLRT